MNIQADYFRFLLKIYYGSMVFSPSFIGNILLNIYIQSYMPYA